MNNEKSTERDLAKIVSTFESNQDLSYKIFDHMPIGICVTDPSGKFTDVNASYCDIYGYTRQELIGQNFTMVVPDDHKSHLKDLHDQFLEKQFELEGRWQVQGKDGNVFDIITNAAFLQEQEGKEKRKMTLVVVADEKEKTIEQLQTTIDILENKITTQDLANNLMEHDMRNRISSMISIADILEKSELNDKQKHWVGLLKNIGMDTLRLLRSSKDFEKMERGTYDLEITQFDLISLIAQQTSDFLDLIMQKELEILLINENGGTLEPEEDELIVKGDEFYLEHLFQNLIKNAAEAAPKKSRISIKITTKEHVNVSIHNQGVIPKEIRSVFFEKYTSKGKERGSGLGTYIAKLIAEIHKGTISFMTKKGHGTTIMVQLPIIKNI